MSLQNIFAKPQFVEGVGNVYPIQLNDWDEFEQYANVLLYSKNHFTTEDYPLLTLVVYGIQKNNIEIVKALTKIFELCLRIENITFIQDTLNDNYHFKIGEEWKINAVNYDEVRQIIMRQNLLFEPKVYKDPLMQAWAEKVLKARNKNAIDMSLEDRISTVATFTGKHYWDIEKYTMYQLSVEFNRICKLKDFEMQTLTLTNPYADTSNMKMSHFAEKVDVFKSPYDDLFKDKSKLNNINKAIKE